MTFMQERKRSLSLYIVGEKRSSQDGLCLSFHAVISSILWPFLGHLSERTRWATMFLFKTDIEINRKYTMMMNNKRNDREHGIINDESITDNGLSLFFPLLKQAVCQSLSFCLSNLWVSRRVIWWMISIPEKTTEYSEDWLCKHRWTERTTSWHAVMISREDQVRIANTVPK